MGEKVSYHLGVHDACLGQGFCPSPHVLCPFPAPGPASGCGRQGLTSVAWGVIGNVSAERPVQL